MHLQRYLLSDRGRGVYFGEHSREHHWDFDWYKSTDKIGITNNPSTEAEHFISGFLVREDALLIVPSPDYPKIKRKSDSFGLMVGDKTVSKNIYELIQLIQGQEITHAYQASIQEDGSYPRILTFSPAAPPAELYVARKIMPIELI
ncbi:hypothetical protein HYV87_00530 [Candidatus Woesearchaeota archaeon]|nr:hypothetical protein [Candidatus Woesearchaeota archaeon]